MLNDGNVIVRDTYINCRYGVTKLENPGASAGEKATLSGCHNGIIFNNRNDRTPFEGSEPWDSCIFERVVFDGVYNAIRIAGKAYKDQKESWRDGPYCIKGIDITDCKINDIIGSYAVVVYKGTFASIDSLRFVDFRFT